VKPSLNRVKIIIKTNYINITLFHIAIQETYGEVKNDFYKIFSKPKSSKSGLQHWKTLFFLYYLQLSKFMD